MRDLFLDQDRAATKDPETILYRVQYWLPVAEGTAGLFWGTTVIEPGRVGDEYFMTHGHFHAAGDRAEFYATVQGRGALILMDESASTWFEPMKSGSLHYIPGHGAQSCEYQRYPTRICHLLPKRRRTRLREHSTPRLWRAAPGSRRPARSDCGGSVIYARVPVAIKGSPTEPCPELCPWWGTSGRLG